MTMRAVVYHGADKPLQVSEVQVPEPGPGQLLLKVDACGICGSDLHAYQYGLLPVGMVFGHEFAGTVVTVGAGAEEGWKPDDRATSIGALFCGTCDACRGSRPDSCEQLRLIGFATPGAYAQYVVVQAAASIKLPPGLDATHGALVEPLAVGLAAYRDARLDPGGNVLVIGAGVIGISVVKWARFFGAGHVGISDLEPARLARARAAGATAAINARDCADPVAAFRTATGSAPDAIVECVGRPILQKLIEAANPGAHIVAVGATMEPEPIISVAAAQKRLRITFSFGYSPDDFRFIVRMIDEGRMTVDSLVTRSVSLDEVPEAFASLQRPNDHCKVMIRP